MYIIIRVINIGYLDTRHTYNNSTMMKICILFVLSFSLGVAEGKQ